MRPPDLSARLSPPPLSLLTDPSHVDTVVAWLKDPRLRGDPMNWIPVGHLLLATVGTPQLWHGPGQHPLRRSIEAWARLAMQYLRTTGRVALATDPTGAHLDGIQRLVLGRLATTLLTALATGHLAPARLRSLQRALAPFREHLSSPEAPATPNTRLHGSLLTAWPLALFATPPAQWAEEGVRLYQHYGRTVDSPEGQQAIDRLMGLLLTRGWSRAAYRDALLARVPAAGSGLPTPPRSPASMPPSSGVGEPLVQGTPQGAPHHTSEDPTTTAGTGATDTQRLADHLTRAVPLLDLVLTATPAQWPRTLPSTLWRPLLLSADPAVRELAIRAMGARPDAPAALAVDAPSPVSASHTAAKARAAADSTDTPASGEARGLPRPRRTGR